MPSSDPRQRLADIVENIEFARAFTADLTIEEFVADRKAFYAATPCLEIISETSRRLRPELKARHPAVDWRRVAGAGNVYRHEYPAVEPRQVWITARGHLDALEAAARRELAALPPAGE